MGTTAAHCREVALSLDGAVEAPHFDYASFRVPAGIFATMPPDGAYLHVFVPEEVRAATLAQHPDSVEKLWWGKQVLGLRVSLAAASPELVESLLRQAHAARVAKKPSRRTRPAGAKSDAKPRRR